MVRQFAKSLLHKNYDPLIVAKVTHQTEQQCWEYLVELQQEINTQAAQRDESIIRLEARGWAELLPETYETKRQLLLERLRNAKTDKEKQERLNHYKVFTNKLQEIPRAQIDRAREYSLKDLLGVSKNITKCPFHDDKTASMNIKNNYWHCHACNLTGDTIDFLMKRDGLSFKEAVLKLT